MNKTANLEIFRKIPEMQLFAALCGLTMDEFIAECNEYQKDNINPKEAFEDMVDRFFPKETIDSDVTFEEDDQARNLVEGTNVEISESAGDGDEMKNSLLEAIEKVDLEIQALEEFYDKQSIEMIEKIGRAYIKLDELIALVEKNC